MKNSYLIFEKPNRKRKNDQTSGSRKLWNHLKASIRWNLIWENGGNLWRGSVMWRILANKTDWRPPKRAEGMWNSFDAMFGLHGIPNRKIDYYPCDVKRLSICFHKKFVKSRIHGMLCSALLWQVEEKLWPILTNFSYFVVNLRAFWCTFDRP